MKLTKNSVIFILVILLAAFLRFYHLGSIPNSISADEAAFGYNAYSILKTGRDEFGHRLPLYLQSFDDNKNPVFAYAQIPFIWLLDLTDTVIRYPSALAGIGVVILAFYVTRAMTGNIKLSLVITLFSAICPWLIQYSRVAIEMELALFFTLAAFWFFQKGLVSPRNLVISAIFWTLSFYTYHSSKLFSIAFGSVLLVLYYKNIRNRYLITSVLVFGILLIPYVSLINSAQLGLRPYVVSVFSNQEDYFENARLITKDQDLGSIDGKIVHNRRLIPLNQAVQGYISVLSPTILFGQNYYNHAPFTRLLYIWMLPLTIVGVYALTRNPRLFILILGWLIIGLSPGGLSKFPPFDRRILLASFPLIFLSAFGYYFLSRLRKQTFISTLIIRTVLVVIPAISVYFYLHYYFVHGRIEVIDTWGNGAREVVAKVNELKHRYDRVIVSIKANQPLTFFLYYEKYPPVQYLAEGGTISGGFADERNKYDKYIFKFIKPEDLSVNTLYIWKTDETQPCLEPLYTINQTNGEKLVNIGAYNPDSQSCPVSDRNRSM